MTVSSIRYFLTASPHPRSVWLVCTAVVVIGGWTVSLDPAGVDTPLASLLVVQMFGAATGFCGPASRGRYDPLFVSGRPWSRIVLAHWAASCLPGWLAWLLIGVAELAVEPGRPPFAFQPRAMAALLLVSAFTWSLTVRVSRFTGGVVWCGALFVAATLRVGAAIITESGLSYLGFGVQPPTPTWGNMLQHAQSELDYAPWTAIFPGLFIFLTVIAVNYIGDGLRDALDPHHVE